MLNPQWKLFADTYLIHRDAKAAAITAGFSTKSAKVQGCKMLRYPEIKNYMEEHAKKNSRQA